MAGSAIASSLLSTSPEGIIAAAVVLTALTCASICLRLLARRREQLPICSDDTTILASASLAVILALILIAGSGLNALGRHTGQDDGTAAEIEEYTYGSWPPQLAGQRSVPRSVEKIALAYSIVEKPAFTLAKISVVLFYRRVFGGSIFSRIAVITCVGLVMLSTAFFMASAAQCPVDNWDVDSWELEIHSNCAEQELVALGFATCNFVTDLFVFCMPLPFIWQLEKAIVARARLFLPFAIANCSIVVSLARMIILFKFTHASNASDTAAPASRLSPSTHKPPANTPRDVLGIISTTLLLSFIELSLTIVAACVPTWRNLLIDLFRMHISDKPLPGPHTDNQTRLRPAAQRFSLESSLQLPLPTTPSLAMLRHPALSPMEAALPPYNDAATAEKGEHRSAFDDFGWFSTGLPLAMTAMSTPRTSTRPASFFGSYVVDGDGSVQTPLQKLSDAASFGFPDRACTAATKFVDVASSSSSSASFMSEAEEAKEKIVLQKSGVNEQTNAKEEKKTKHTKSRSGLTLASLTPTALNLKGRGSGIAAGRDKIRETGRGWSRSVSRGRSRYRDRSESNSSNCSHTHDSNSHNKSSAHNDPPPQLDLDLGLNLTHGTLRHYDQRSGSWV